MLYRLHWYGMILEGVVNLVHESIVFSCSADKSVSAIMGDCETSVQVAVRYGWLCTSHNRNKYSSHFDSRSMC